MRVIRAKTAGFCMGVSLALNKLDQTLNSTLPPQPLVMLGPIIHNPQVLDDYAARDVNSIERIEDVPAGGTAIIRAHGLPVRDEERLRTMGVTIVDATCPKVKKAQLAIAKATANGTPLLLFGEHEHPEVRGLVSYAGGPCQVFAEPQEVLETPFTGPLVLAAQTTQDSTAFKNLARQLRARLPNLTVLSTICNATSCRQEEAIGIARKVDMMIVVGGRQSGNTRRLAHVAEAIGTPTRHIETLAELGCLPKDVSSVGLTAGASTPRGLIDEVQRFLESLP